MSVVINPRKQTKFQLKSIKSYCSDEWMAGATKKYRTVYDRSELQYVRCELALHNLEMGGAAWTINTIFKCIETTNGLRKEICSIDNTVQVTPDTDVVYVRDGWGAAEAGSFWTKGNYSWEVYVDDQKIGDTSFVVNDMGLVSRVDNPYFSVESIKFYGGDFNGWEIEPRNYMESFARAKTQYVWAEVNLVNKTDKAWNYELFFNFYDSARQLKGQIVRTGLVDANRREYKYSFDAGWGNNVPGSWKSDQYYFDVVFMDKLIASSCFYTGEADKPGVPSLLKLID